MKFNNSLKESGLNYSENPYMFDVSKSFLAKNYIRFEKADWDFKKVKIEVYNQKIKGKDHVKDRFSRTDDTYRVGSKHQAVFGDIFDWPDDYILGLKRCFRKIEKKFKYKKGAYIVRDNKTQLLYYIIIGGLEKDPNKLIAMVNTLLGVDQADEEYLSVSHRGSDYEFQYIKEFLNRNFNLPLMESNSHINEIFI